MTEQHLKLCLDSISRVAHATDHAANLSRAAASAFQDCGVRPNHFTADNIVQARFARCVRELHLPPLC